MYHKHFETIDSTQIYLKDNIEKLLVNNSSILVSCNHQTNGIGRTGNNWHFQGKSLAMSFTFTPHQNLTLTPIEIGILVCHFFKLKYEKNIYLKWPNDLMTFDNKKIGGIITNFYNSSNIIAGIGINIGTINKDIDKFRYEIDSIYIDNFSQEKLSSELFDYLLKNRINSNDKVVLSYHQLCNHMNRNISLIDNQKIFNGIFIGIDTNGAALIESNGQTSTHVSGSLAIN